MKITLTKQEAEELLKSSLNNENRIITGEADMVQEVEIEMPEIAIPMGTMTFLANDQLDNLLRKDNWQNGSKKFANIKALRELIPGLSLCNAKWLVEGGRDN